MSSDVKHVFGGDHTEIKLEIIRAYAGAFQQALKNKGFETWYIDPFAGTGERTQKQMAGGLLTGTFVEEVEVTHDGSARLALDTQPPFDHYRLADRKPAHAKALQSLVEEYPHLDVQARKRDANVFVREVLAERLWSERATVGRQRGMVFLDPYGMEVSWDTLELLAKVGQLDVFFLFNAKSVRQQLCSSLDRVDEGKAAALDRFFGEPTWRKEFFSPPTGQGGLFDDDTSKSETAVNLPAIGDYAKKRFGQKFRWVSDPKRLKVRHVDDYFQLFCMTNTKSNAALGLIQRLHAGVVTATEKAFHRKSGH